jgi:hypothetical protein
MSSPQEDLASLTLRLADSWHSAKETLQAAVGGAQGVGEDEAEGLPSVSALTLADLNGQAEAYEANNNVIYREDFFDNATWAAIVAESKRLWGSTDMEPNCNLDGVNRLGGYIIDNPDSESSLYRLIYGNEGFRRWVTAVNGKGEMWPSDFPIELREYGENSKGMGCHSDLKMYLKQPMDTEFAMTVDNDSGCTVTFIDKQGKKHEVHTKANSVMMVRAEAAVHCVSSTKGGVRSIIKFIYAGDYRKSRQFWEYTDNVCSKDNPNVQALLRRRMSLNSNSEL